VLAEEYQAVYFPGDDLLAAARPRGLPIGNLTSQWWANCYLTPFDHFVKRELGCKGYLRYVDDFLLFSDDKRQLREWREALVERLEQFRLTIHAESAAPRPVTEGISFLGFIVFPGRRRLKARKGWAFQRRLKYMLRTEAPHLKIRDSLRGWINHARYANTVGLRRALLAACGLLGEA
jgi:hypothetical protein